MKKIMAGVLIVVVLIYMGVYFLIPDNLNIAKVSMVNTSAETIFRFLSNANNWKKWWPDSTKSPQPNSLNYNNLTYTINKAQHNTFEIIMTDSDEKFSSTLQILPFPSDSSAIEWKSNVTPGNDLVSKVRQYRKALIIKKNMDKILMQLEKFLQVKENIYGIRITQTSTRDTLLVAIKSSHTSYPSTAVVYGTIAKLQKYLDDNKAQQTGRPLLNISQVDSGYEMMIALPTDVKLNPKGSIFFRRMVPGNFLVSEVYGGEHTVQQAITTIQHYITDNKRTSMAIPFQSLITDRSKEPDTLKWLTKVYYPVK